MAFRKPVIVEGVDGLHGIGSRVNGGGVLLKPGNDVELVTEAVKGMLRGEVASDKEVRSVMQAITLAVGRTGCVQIEGMEVDPREKEAGKQGNFSNVHVDNIGERDNPLGWHAHWRSPEMPNTALYAAEGERFRGPPTYVAKRSAVLNSLQRRAKIESFSCGDVDERIAQELRLISYLQEHEGDMGGMIDAVAADDQVEVIRIDWRDQLLAIFSDRSMVHARPQWRGLDCYLRGVLRGNTRVKEII